MISHQRIKSQHAFQAALYLGLRKKEWLFLTCHNYWVVFRLVKGNDESAFLAFSPFLTMEGSSVPFRAFLGAILSAVKGVAVGASVFDRNQPLDTIDEEVEEESSSTSDADDCSGEYRARPGQGPVGPTRRRAQGPGNEAALMV